MAKVKSVNRKEFFCYGNAPHEKWLGSSTTVHGTAALDFQSSLGCNQIVTEPHVSVERFLFGADGCSNNNNIGYSIFITNLQAR